MWTKRESVDPMHSKSYLFKVAYNEMIDQIRKRKPVAEMEDLPVYGERHDTKKIIEEALSRLTPTQRALILLKDADGYSYEEIASITGLNFMQVKVYLHRARLQVKSFLGSLENVLDPV
jgi:RNA polymerase sigma-70 factor (ECF subfamily)